MDNISLLDQKQFYKFLLNKSFYILCPDDENYYRTLYCKWNIFTNSPQILTSNPIYGNPPTNIEPMSPMMYSRIKRSVFNSPPPF